MAHALQKLEPAQERGALEPRVVVKEVGRPRPVSACGDTRDRSHGLMVSWQMWGSAWVPCGRCPLRK